MAQVPQWSPTGGRCRLQGFGKRVDEGGAGAVSPPRSGGTRSKSRDSRIPPQRDATFADVELAELRAMRSGLTDEESKVPYWRRIVQARIDLLGARDRPGIAAKASARVPPIPARRTGDRLP